MMKNIITIMLAVLIGSTVYAKPKRADRLFDRWEYFRAEKLYSKYAKKHPSAEAYFKVGECLRKMNCCKAREQAAYDKVNAAGTYSDPLFYLHYGQVLKTNGKYEQAKTAFDKYAEMVPNDPRGAFYSASIGIAQEDRQSDEPITLINLASVNSSNSDFSPVLYKDGIVFASARPTAGHGKVYGWTGGRYLDLYYAERGKNAHSFKNAEPFGGKKLSKKYHDGPVSFSSDYNTVYISRVAKDLKGDEKTTLGIERNKIFFSTMQDGEWTKEVPFAYNSNTYSMASPFLSPDGSRLYFVSDMPGGYGETDIYYCLRKGNEWGKPINMGPNVNTFNREKYPMEDSLGNFYFSSDGYQGFGGMDICVALNDRGNLSKAKPLKYPFNSTADDHGIVFLQNGKIGYIVSDRAEGGMGDDDIFHFDLTGDNVDENLVTSDYTIGYKPKPKLEPEVIVAVVEPVSETVVAMPQVEVIPQVDVTLLSPGNGSLYFDYGKSNLRSLGIVYLDKVVTYMKADPEAIVTIGGHTDERGSAVFNMGLSKRRNDSAMGYLKSKGINTQRMRPTAYGLTEMVNKCVKGVYCSEPEHQLNRRVDLNFNDLRIGEVE